MRYLSIIALLALGCEQATDPEPAGVADVYVPDAQGGGDVSTPPDVHKPICPANACDDGLSCTEDTCDATTGKCSWALLAETCLINGVCYEAGDAHLTDGCRVCDPVAPHVWSNAADGASCDDGDACTVGDVCVSGGCEGATIPCDDGNVCTQDECVDGACEYGAVGNDTPCNDGSECTEMDACTFGVCTGAPVACDDGDPCTEDTCAAPGGCVHEPHDGACNDGDACTEGDLCTDGDCVPGAPVTCDDGNACTIDQCSPAVGCVHLPTQTPCCIGVASVCDDGNACTDDLCDPESFDCEYVAITGTYCDDGLMCTADDTCESGACVGQAPLCDDGNPCTQDYCNEGVGCSFVPQTGKACDDGLECTVDTMCVAGKCVGDDSECLCAPDLGTDAAKITSLAIGTQGKAGEGLDLDGDPSTCAPTPGCTDGVHNSFSALAALANGPLQDAVESGSVMLVMELPDSLAGSFALNLYPAEVFGECDFQSATCDYLVKPESLDPNTCAPLFSLPATVEGSTLTAGGSGSVIPFSFPVQGLVLDVSIFNAQIQAQLTTDDSGVTGMTGILGGAIKKTALMQAVDNLPDDGLPVSKDLIKTILGSTLQYDIDTDGDQQGDAASIGLKVQAIDANLIGVD